MNVLFVCTGNICRSPMAEHYFRKMLRDAGRNDVTVASSGVAAEVGYDMTNEARIAMKKLGWMDAPHKAQSTSAELVKNADLILVMESRHKNAVLSRFPEAASKTYLLNEYAGFGALGIDDPYGESQAFYGETLAEIKRALEKVLERLPNKET